MKTPPTTEAFQIIILAIYAIGLLSWPVNAYRLFKCDFKPSYKGEVIHAIGIFTPTCLVTAWSNFDK